jgi:uncharacterized protein involved in outer membrane biogenesis
MTSTIKKWVIRPLLILLTVVVAVAATGFLLISTQQERIVKAALTEVNKQFRGELAIRSSEISILKNFPYVSVVLHDVEIFSDKTKIRNPISKIYKLYVGFSISDIVHEHYNVKALFLQGGYVELVREKDGKINLVEAESSPETTTYASSSEDSSVMAIDLQKIVVQDLNVSFVDKQTGQKVNTKIDKVLSSFQMDSTSLSVAAEGNLVLDVGSETDSAFFHDKKIQLNIMADYHQHAKKFELNHCRLKLENAEFSISGFANAFDTTEVNFTIKGDEHDFDMVTAFLPNDVSERLKPFKYDGQLLFDAKNSFNAPNPPADAPIPTIMQLLFMAINLPCY